MEVIIIMLTTSELCLKVRLGIVCEYGWEWGWEVMMVISITFPLPIVGPDSADKEFYENSILWSRHTAHANLPSGDQTSFT